MDTRIFLLALEFAFQGEFNFKPSLQKSSKWYNWVAMIDLKTCAVCRNNHGQIRDSVSSWAKKPPVHPVCRCKVVFMDAIVNGTATINGKNGADWWLKNNGILPDYYISKEEAMSSGWISRKGNLHIVANGKQIGGDIFYNDKKKLPDAPGRIWYEADINYKKGFRNKHRVLCSNDGLIFVTYDHYKTFFEII